MKTTHLLAPLAGIAIALAATAGLVACSSDDTNGGNPTPTRDGGGGMDSSMGMDTGSQTDTGGGSDSSNDVNTNCMSDAANCNSCVTPAQDPYNACSSATANCIKFDNSRVPPNVPSP